MPYYKDINLLFIHVPKTGGTTLESLLGEKSCRSLYSGFTNNVLPPEMRKQSLQHLTYLQIYEYKDILKVPFDEKLKLWTIVRNPYTRTVSDLFFFNKINKNTSQQQVHNVLKSYVHDKNLDNHNLPQYHFLIDQSGALIKNLVIMRKESLNQDLLENGVQNNKKLQVGKETENNYMKYLNRDSLDIINQFYSKDFELFNYEKI